MKRVVLTLIIALTGGFGGAFLFYTLNTPINETPDSLSQYHSDTFDNQEYSRFIDSRSLPADFNDDFVVASEASRESVVYIKNISETSYGRTWLDMFFGESPRSYQTVSSGSGVIFSSDGYIVTNNHVVENADQIVVVYNRNEFEAILVGRDPSTDIAVLKVEAEDLPTAKPGSSQDLKVGEWVLAIGNPFNLTSTVTAGIVSAKGRKIDILKDKFPVESFIQTDAAINPGNSGGALVNRRGELVGINTAIFSKTGSYVGYGFAVPIDIVSKIVSDIIRYGEVQKAFFGANVATLNAKLAKRLDLIINTKNLSGVVLTYVQKEGAAEKSGLKEGDVVVGINGNEIENESDFEETISYFSPGDQLDVTILTKDGRKQTKTLTLLNRNGTTEITHRMVYSSKSLGAEFEKVSKVEKDLHDIKSGVKIVKVNSGLINAMRLREGYIITSVNGQPVNDPKTLTEVLVNIQGRVIVEFVDTQGQKKRYPYYF